MLFLSKRLFRTAVFSMPSSIVQPQVIGCENWPSDGIGSLELCPRNEKLRHTQVGTVMKSRILHYRLCQNILCSQFDERLWERVNCPPPIVGEGILIVDAAQLFEEDSIEL